MIDFGLGQVGLGGLDFLPYNYWELSIESPLSKVIGQELSIKGHI